MDPHLEALVANHRRFLAFLERRLGPVDVAGEEGISANNAMVRLHRARRALRERLVLSCRSCTEHACLDCTCRSPRPVGA